MYNIIEIEKFRKFIYDNHYRCFEAHSKECDKTFFTFMTNKEDKTLNVLFNPPKDGHTLFDGTLVMGGSFECGLDAALKYVLYGDYSYVRQYYGDEIIDLSQYDKITKND